MLCVASVLYCVAVGGDNVTRSSFAGVAVCCSVLQGVAVCSSVWQCVADIASVLY